MERLFWSGLLAAFCGFFPIAWGQTPLPSPTSTTLMTPSPTPDPGEDTSEATDDEKDEKPFISHWTGQVGSSLIDQISQGQSQTQKQINLNATYSLTESGHYFMVGITGGQQVVEGLDTNYGQLNLAGGLGLGLFLPALQLQTQQGASALNSYTGTLTLNFKLFDNFQLGPLITGGLESHQGPLDQLGFTSDKVDEVDSGNFTLGAAASYTPWDILALTLTAQQEYDDTYQFQNVVHTVLKKIDQRDTISSLSLEEDLTCWKNFQWQLTEQGGLEELPKGIAYSPILRKTVFNKTPTDQSFTGLTVGLVYNFE